MIVYRFHFESAAALVAQYVQRLTNVSIRVAHIPAEDNRPDPPGPWCITADCEENIKNRHKMYAAADAAIQHALVDGLRASDPENPMCKIWHLLPKNQTLTKYNITE